MIVNKAAISGAFVSLRALYNKAFSETESFWQKVAMRIPSNTKQEDYAWLSNFPKIYIPPSFIMFVRIICL